MNDEQIAKWWRWGPDVVQSDLLNAQRNWQQSLDYLAEAEIEQVLMKQLGSAHNIIPGSSSDGSLPGSRSEIMTFTYTSNVDQAKADATAALVAIDAVMEMAGSETPPPATLVNKIFPTHIPAEPGWTIRADGVRHRAS